ncbi:MFS transporter [Leptolyngbya sp. 'hensonii']|uniref:MFS transporter n=1 Tax=Leptolyngbya sp. 'hensonii' TaxID=1922337 RepID=UPI0009502D0A|nr:MFS transporter [Leptolyngbya sp. 'hensonii']OLP17773.1 MFS transporter [Leptolyngbya sp. 'hensonii']
MNSLPALFKNLFAPIPLNVWILGFVSLFTDMGSGVVYALLPFFLVSTLGANLLTVGLIEGIAEATAAIAKIFSGTLSDFWQNRKVLALVGYSLSALSKPLFALTITPAGVLGVFLCDRLGKGIRVAPRDALIADTTPAEQLGAAYGLRQSLDTIGAFLGPLAAFALMALTAQDFRLVFELTLVPGILAVGLLLWGIREPEKLYVAKARPNPFNGTALKQLGQKYWVLLVIALIASLGNSSNAFLLLRASEIGIATTWIPLALVIMNITYFLSAYPAGFLSDRLGRNGVLLSGFLLFSLVYGGFAFAQTPWQAWVLFGFYGVHLGMNKGILSALIADTVPAPLRGTAFGLFNFAMGLTLFLASFLAGGLWQWQGSRVTFLLGSVLTAIAALMFLIQARFPFWQTPALSEIPATESNPPA